MSEASPTFPDMTFHPWRRLRELAHVTLGWHDGGDLGWCVFDESSLSLQRGMTQAERRSTICHELVHLERGPAFLGYEEADEAAVAQESARRLITLDELGQALQWTVDVDELADELWVDVDTIRTRMNHLHPSEVHELRRIVAAKEETA